jgi:hypothetical protein
VSLTPLKRFRRCHWHRLNDFRGVNDTAEINVTPLKSQTDFTSPYSSVKGKIQRKYFNGKYPHTTVYKYLKQKKVGGSKTFQRCQWHRWNRFCRLSKRLSRRIRCHMQNGFSLLIIDKYGVDWWKKPEGRKSRATVPLNQARHWDTQ